MSDLGIWTPADLPPRPADDILAHHEAGHAVASIVKRRPFEYVTIDANFGGDPASVQYCHDSECDLPEIPEARRIELIERDVFIYMAGPTAQARFKPPWDEPAAAGDWFLAMDRTSTRNWSPEDRDRYVRAMCVVARKWILVPQVWLDVQAIAEALIERRRLDYQEAKIICKGVYQV